MGYIIHVSYNAFNSLLHAKFPGPTYTNDHRLFFITFG